MNFNNWDSAACVNDTDIIQNEVFRNINIYDLYGDCIHGEDSFADNQILLKFLKQRNPTLEMIPP